MPYDYEGYYFDFIDSNCSKPSCYLTLQTSNLAPGGRGADNNPGSAPDDTAELTGRTESRGGDVGHRLRRALELPEPGLRLHARWAAAVRPSQEPGSGYPVLDCPFSAGGATGAGSGDCVGSSPSYYETLQAANIDGVAGDELLARASDGCE